MPMQSQQESIRQDYELWSGGFPPETEDAIFLYLEYACPKDCPQDEVRAILYAWAAEASRRR